MLIYSTLISSIIIGALLVLFLKPNNLLVKLLLAFSGAYLLSVTVLHLIPEVYQHSHTSNHLTDNKIMGVLILLGILMQSVLEFFSKGIEHGHVHIDKSNTAFPWSLFIGLCVHAFTEGLPIHIFNDEILWAIVIHKIPIAIVLTTFLIHSKISKVKIFLVLLLFSAMSPLGYFIGSKSSFFLEFHAEITAIVIGIFLHISTIILFETSENHRFNLKKFISIISGIIVAIITL